MILKVKKLKPWAIIPQYQTDGSVAFDLHSCDDISIYPGGLQMVHCGIAVEVPPGHEMQVRQRSGISLQFPNYIAICVGTIDQDYRGEIMVPVRNNNKRGDYFEIKKGDRIAQAVISPVAQCKIKEVVELSTTERGTGGFGHTGKE